MDRSRPEAALRRKRTELPGFAPEATLA